MLYTIALLLISEINDWKRPYTPPNRPSQTVERTVNGVTYGTYVGGGYTIQQVGPVVIINNYTAPTYPVGGLPKTVISYGPRNSTNRGPGNQLERIPSSHK